MEKNGKRGEAYKTKYGYLSITAEQRKELKRFELKKSWVDDKVCRNWKCTNYLKPGIADCWETTQMDHGWWWRAGRDHGWTCTALAAPHATCLRGKPDIDKILGQANAGSRPSDGDLPISRSFHWVCNFDLRPRHLTDLIDFGALTPDYAANQIIWNGEFMRSSLSRRIQTC